MTAGERSGAQMELTAAAALAARLRSAADVLLDHQAGAPESKDRIVSADPTLASTPLPAPAGDPAADAAVLLELAVRAVSADLTDARVWLLLTAIAGCFPVRDEVDEARREFELTRDPAELCRYLLDVSLPRAAASGWATATLGLAVGAVLVEVDQSAKHDLHTGIQQVTRNLLPRWHAAHPVVPVAWTDSNGCLRSLDATETDRVLRWHGGRAAPAAVRDPTGNHTDVRTITRVPQLVVPWRSVVVLVDNPEQDASDRLAALAAYSGNRLVAVAYDAIPIASADLIPLGGSGRFGRYLAAIKFARRVAGISATATAEIAGFVAALPTQGLTGPVVVEVSLPAPVAAPSSSAAVTSPAGPAMILVVGSHEPRKNHLAVLQAAELLWQQGLQFSVQFIGGMSWGHEFGRRVADLTAKRRPIQVRVAVDDDALSAAFEAARFTVFPSLHEGYGLPVAESFAHRTPVITADFGSTAEIAAAGGALLVDPRDDDALTAAIRALLTDDDELDRLRAAIDRRTDRTWDDYAGELWNQIVAPELTDLG